VTPVSCEQGQRVADILGLVIANAGETSAVVTIADIAARARRGRFCAEHSDLKEDQAALDGVLAGRLDTAAQDSSVSVQARQMLAYLRLRVLDGGIPAGDMPVTVTVPARHRSLTVLDDIAARLDTPAGADGGPWLSRYMTGGPALPVAGGDRSAVIIRDGQTGLEYELQARRITVEAGEYPWVQEIGLHHPM
jgi:hypothetical protein